MNKKALRTLEFDKILLLLETFAQSAPGKDLCRSLSPMTDVSQIEELQLQTQDAFSRIMKKGKIPFSGNTRLKGILKSLEIESPLSSSELLKIADSLECTNRVKTYGRPEREDETPDCLTPFFEALSPLTPLLNEIRRCILGEDEYSDDASPSLKQIRRSLISTQEKIHAQLAQMVNSTHRTYLQDPVITMRNNRYCIPVKSEYKGQVPGMVHDQSSSGSTFFIEPSAVVTMNNQIRELELEEQEEINRILAALSRQASNYINELSTNESHLTQLDFIFARGLLALDMNASRPIFNRDKIINIRQGRHPLLDKKKAVPIDVHLGKDFDLLVVTGPNTGGKTVSLKTVGLFTLMGQAGLHIPARDRSELSVFHEVYADIGDEQSIEQSLSTFSSHMTNTVTILDHADENSLCLFDELGAGTDPTEGAALAMAILTYLHDRGIRTMATTHYSELKIFALSTDFVENACCEFDVASLRPTYRLLIGIPGKSNAFAISSKLGLSDQIIESAKEFISQESESFEDVISQLDENRKKLEAEQEAIKKYKQEILSLKEELKNKQEKLDQTKDKLLREANEKARDILQDAKDLADQTIRDFQKYGKTSSAKEMEAGRDKLRKKISEKNENLSLKKTLPGKKQLDPKKIKLGESVQVISMGLKGTINSLPDKKGNLYVQCGIIRSQVNINDLVLIDEEPILSGGTKKKYSGVSGGLPRSSGSLSKASSMSMELNLLGKTVDEALSQLDKYLDDAYLSHLSSVRIVHGKGTGALRNAVHQYLKKASYVKSYRLGEHGEGDAGVTIVEFK